MQIQSLTHTTKDQFASPEAYMVAVAHELIHATMNKTPQFSPDQIPPYADMGDANYAREEWRAELGAVALLDKIGAKVNIANSARYIDFWSMAMQDDKLVRILADERDTKIEQSITAANFLLEQAGLSPLNISPDALQALKEINQAYPHLPLSLQNQPQAPETTQPNVPQRRLENVKDLFNSLYQAALTGDQEALSRTMQANLASPVGQQLQADMLERIEAARAEQALEAQKALVLQQEQMQQQEQETRGRGHTR